MRESKILLLIFLAAALQYCCSTKNIAAAKEPAVSYQTDIAPIMQSRCSPCHFPDKGKVKPLDTYTAVKTNFTNIIKRVQLAKEDARFMPFKSKKEPLSDSLIAVFKKWQQQNMPE